MMTASILLERPFPFLLSRIILCTYSHLNASFKRFHLSLLTVSSSIVNEDIYIFATYFTNTR